MLGFYCKRVTESRGLEHKATLGTIRNYIKFTPTKELLEAINLIDKLEYLKALWEAGLTTELQTAVTNRHSVLMLTGVKK